MTILHRQPSSILQRPAPRRARAALRAWLASGLAALACASACDGGEDGIGGDSDARNEPGEHDAGGKPDAQAATDAMWPLPADGAPELPVLEWHACGDQPLARELLLALPGGGSGPPVVTSNNPEVFTGDGLLFGTARASAARGGASTPLAEVGVYVHHINGTSSPKYVTVLVTNPNASPVTVSVRGSGYSQDETGGLALGASPDYRVSEDWITDAPRTVIDGFALESMRPMIAWQTQVGSNRELDGRFQVSASAPVYVYVVATSTSDINEAVTDGLVDAPGVIASPGDPPPPFGREAGVYEHDTWRGEIAAQVPAGTGQVGWWVNTATGIGAADVQAFAAISHYSDSAAEAVGMYGNVYDLEVTLEHDGDGSAAREVAIGLSSYGAGSPSRFWDGVALVDGTPRVLRNTPEARYAPLANVSLAPGERRTVRVQAMVPGLTSIPQVLIVDTGCP